MMNYPRHLKNNYLAVIISVLFFASCSENEKVPKSVVKVNESVLTEEDLDSALSDNRNSGKYREEYIQNWIETEVLYQKAVKEGITDNYDYKKIIENSGKKLAASILLQKFAAENKITPSNDELKKFFDDSTDDFRLNEDVYKINVVKFNNFDDAVKFRNILLGSQWNVSINAFRGDKSLIDEKREEIINSSQIHPSDLFKTVSNLGNGEISLVTETEPSEFTVVQLVDKLQKGTIPPFEMIRERVLERYIILKQKEFVRGYIDKLVADHNVEIKRYSE